jgi:hypothetical protein
MHFASNTGSGSTSAANTFAAIFPHLAHVAIAHSERI